eukprot:gene25827-biopygen21023
MLSPAPEEYSSNSSIDPNDLRRGHRTLARRGAGYRQFSAWVARGVARGWHGLRLCGGTGHVHGARTTKRPQSSTRRPSTEHNRGGCASSLACLLTAGVRHRNLESRKLQSEAVAAKGDRNRRNMRGRNVTHARDALPPVKRSSTRYVSVSSKLAPSSRQITKKSFCLARRGIVAFSLLRLRLGAVPDPDHALACGLQRATAFAGD